MGTFTPVIVAAATLATAIPIAAIAASALGRAYYSRFDRVRAALPDFNCGACGFSECIDYAVAVAKGNADPLACVPGGPGTAHAIADVLERTAAVAEPAMAAVHCNGGTKEAARLARYEGVPDCRAALLIGNGVIGCADGCLGLGSCVSACPFGALSITPDEASPMGQTTARWPAGMSAKPDLAHSACP